MTEIALSSGCFINQEDRLTRAGVKAIELSSHHADKLDHILDTLKQNSVRILSVHCPCPNRGIGLNLASKGEQWGATADSVCEAMEIAAALQAKYIVIHAFYCVLADLPSNDIQRMAALRRLFGEDLSIAEYVASEAYMQAKEQTKQNLRSLLPELKRKYPQQKIVLENLNPRIGYGGIRFEDVVDLVETFDGDVGICLDVGHLTLSETALGCNMEEAVLHAKQLIWTAHIHQNFAGRFCVDRNWNESVQQHGLQEVDTHLPLLTRYRATDDELALSVTADNSAFHQVLEGAVQYTADENEELVDGAVPVERFLSLIASSAHCILEYDSRYAPLDEILTEYHLLRRGLHPIIK